MSRATRAQRLTAILADLANVYREIEGLRDELQAWQDNIPENLQGGAKYDELQETIEALEETIEALDSAESAAGDVVFPGMC